MDIHQLEKYILTNPVTDKREVLIFGESMQKIELEEYTLLYDRKRHRLWVEAEGLRNENVPFDPCLAPTLTLKEVKDL